MAINNGEQGLSVRNKLNGLISDVDILKANPSVYELQGTITLSADFPTPATVQAGWLYVIGADVTDNDATKTNTGQSFLAGVSIVWAANGTWLDLGSNYVTQERLDKLAISRNFMPLVAMLGSVNDYVNVDTTELTISFPALFYVQSNTETQGRIVTSAPQNISLVCTGIDGVTKFASSQGVLLINKITHQIINLYNYYFDLGVSNDWVMFGYVKRSTPSTTVSGNVRITGNFDYKINGAIVGDSNTRTLFPALNMNANNEYVNFNRSTLKIDFPANFNVFGNDKESSIIKSVPAQSVSLVCTDINNVPLTSSIGALIINNKTTEIKHLYWNTYVNTYVEGYTLIGYVKRSSASLTVAGDLQVICMFPYLIDGIDPTGGNISESVIDRNIDVQSLVSAAIFPKQIGGIQTSRFNILHYSDVHSDLITTQNFINYLNSNDKIQQGLDTGDVAAGNFSEDLSSLFAIQQSTSKPVLKVIGNHDTGNSKTVSICGTNAEVYAKFIQPFETNGGMITNGKNYWYKDDATHKIRAIGLYEYDDPNDLDTDPLYYKILRGVRVFSQAQIDWFTNLLLNTPSDYGVIIYLHQFPVDDSAELVENPLWTSTGAYGIQTLMTGNIINEIVQAWIDGVAINKSFPFIGDASYLSDIVVSTSFATRGSGEFIAYLFGHTHRDKIGAFVSYPTQNYICITCASSSQNQSQFDDLPRVAGNKTEDAINLISIDRDNRKIYVVRIGSNKTSDLTDRTFIKIDY